MENFDVVVLGAGIVGITSALEIKRKHPSLKVAILEKEAKPGTHASGRNSGVLHSGIYYPADTMKAKVCSAGNAALKQYALERKLKMNATGKVIVAQTGELAGQLDTLEERARKNDIRVERLDEAALKKMEPHARSIGKALYCPDTAIVDPKEVVAELVKDLAASGVRIFTGTGAREVLPKEKTVITRDGAHRYGHLLNCAGAYADRIAHLFGVGMDLSILPFRGSYYRLSKKKNDWVRGNIYPVPDLKFPFLGVHFTRSVSGEVYIGPTALPALGRENYYGLGGANLSEAPGIVWRLGKMYLGNEQNFRGLVHSELARLRKSNFLKEAALLVPGLEEDDLEPCEKAGIRPQAVDVKRNRLEMDFRIENGPDSTHVLNAISPAFTSSFPFAKLIVDRMSL